MNFQCELNEENKIKGEKIAGYKFLRVICLAMVIGLIGVFIFEGIFLCFNTMQALEFESVGEMVAVNVVFLAFLLFFLFMYLWVTNSNVYLFPEKGFIVSVNTFGMRKETYANFDNVVAELTPHVRGGFSATLYYNGKVVARTLPIVSDDMQQQLEGFGITNIVVVHP